MTPAGTEAPSRRAWSVLVVLALAFLTVAAVRWYGRAVAGQYAVRAQARPRVDVNRAGLGEFLILPGIQETLAHRILVERERHGPYRDAADLRDRVEGIGEGKLGDLLPYLTFIDAPLPE